MSKVAPKSTPVPTRRPVRSRRVTKPVSKPSSPANTSKPADVAKTSSEAKAPEKSSSGTSSLISGLLNWGSSGTAKAGDTKEAQAGAEAKKTEPLTLDKGQFLRKGASGDKVTQLQELLNSKGAQLDVDGKFGPKTLKALQKFQGDSELKADGVVGPNTLGALNGTSESSGKDGAQTGGEVKLPATGQEVKPPAQGEQAQPPAKTDGAQQGNGQFGNTRESLNNLPGPLKKYADVFQAAGEKYGVDPRFLAAISMHETGNGTSSAFRNKNNAMGISGKKGPLHISSVEASIDKMARGLAKPTGYYKGKTTIGGVANIYAPVGAGNDPNGLNGYWAKGVARNFRKFGGDPSQQVIFRNRMS